MRSFTNNFLAQAANQSALPYLVLEIDWGGPTGVQYYLDRSPASFVNNDGFRFPTSNVSSVLVLNWGHIGVTLKDGEIGATDQTTVTLDDSGGAITGILNSIDQQRRQFTIWRMFDDPSVKWNTDKGRIFTGVLRPFSWSASDQQIVLNLGDLGPLLAKDVSLIATDAAFDKLPPSSKQKTIPLCWGRAQRVEALPISVPWETRIAEPTTVANSEDVPITDDPDDLPGVIPETPYAAVLGTQNVTATFHLSSDPDSQLCTVTLSEPGPQLLVSVLAEMWPAQTTQYFWAHPDITDVNPREDVLSLDQILTIGMDVSLVFDNQQEVTGFKLASVALEPAGTLIGLPGDAMWGGPMWRFSFTDNADGYLEQHFYTNNGEFEINQGGGGRFRFYSQPTLVDSWPAGTVLRSADQTTICAVNSLPSKAVLVVEGFGSFADSAGPTRQGFVVLGPIASSYVNGSSASTSVLDGFSVNTNDSTWGAAAKLGQNITTITFPGQPRDLYPNLDDNRIWCTVLGVDDAGNGSGNPITNPATVILQYLENAHLMDVDPSFIDASSFSTAAAALSGLSVGFAQLETRRGLDLLQEIAMQCNSVLLFDQGVVRMVVLSDAAATPVATFDTTSLNNYQLDSLVTDETAVEDGANQLIGQWTAYWDDIAGNIPMEVRASKVASIGELGPISLDLPIYLYWRRADVETEVGWWLDHHSTIFRTVTFTAYLGALVLEPGDWISVSWVDSTGRNLFGGAQSMMVVKATDRASDQLVDIEARYPKFTFAS